LRRISTRRLATTVAAMCLAALGVPALASAAQCANSDVAPQAGNLGDVRSAVLCLVNSERSARGLGVLRVQAQLARAADGHAQDMATQHFFAHESRNGRTVTDRVRATGYLPKQVSWTLGETLAWGTGRLATAAATVDAWMHSPDHRTIMLSPKYRDAGIGIAIGAPDAALANGATVTMDVGRRGASAKGARASKLRNR